MVSDLDAKSPRPFSSRRAYTLLFVALVAIGMGQTMLFAVLAPLGREIGLSDVQVGAIISASSISFFLFSNVWGRVSDRWGRRRVILIGLSGYTLGTLVFASGFQAALLGVLAPTPAFFALTLSRMAQSSVMSATPPAASAFMADITTPATRTRGMGYLGAAQNVGSIGGPAVGGLLAAVSLLAPIWLAAGLTFVAAVLVFCWLPEPARRATSGARISLHYTDPRIVPFVVVGIVMFTGFAIVQQTLAFRMQDVLGLTGRETARLFGLSMVLSGVSSLLAQILIVQRVARPPLVLLRAAMPALLVAFGIMAVAAELEWFLVAMSALGLGMGIAAPSFMAGASLAVSPDEQGAVAGLTSSCPPLGFTIGPLLGTTLYQLNGQLPYLIALSLYVPLTAFTLWARVAPPPRS